MTSETPDTYETITTSGGLRERAKDNLGIKEVKEFLEMQGYEKLGEGCVGAVYAKPGEDTVIKVAHRHDTWMMIAREQLRTGYKNPHLQTVHSLHIFKDGFVARMERLEAHNGLYGARAAARAGDEWLRWEIRGRGFQEKRPFLSTSKEAALTFCLNATHSLGESKRMPDLHANNIMMRGGTHVYIDPIHCEVGAAA